MASKSLDEVRSANRPQLLVLDPNLHVGALAVHVVVEPLRTVGHLLVGDHEEGVRPDGAVLGLDDAPPFAGSSPGSVLEVVE